MAGQARGRRPSPAAVALLLLLLPFAAPAAAAEAGLAVHAADIAVHGRVAAAAPSAAIVWNDSPEGDGSALPDFRLAAALVHVAEDRSDRPYVATGFPLLPANETTVPAVLHNATIAGLELGPGFRLIVYPGQGPLRVSFAFDEGTLRLGTADPSLSDQKPYANTTRPPADVDAAEAVACALPAGTVVRFEGSFRVALWEGSFRAASDEGSRSFRSGQSRADIVPSPIPSLRGVEHTWAVEHFLEVQEGLLEVRWDAGMQGLVGSPRLQGRDATLEATGVTGDVWGAPTGPAGQGSIAVQGSWTAAVEARDAHGIPLRVDGDGLEVLVDGEAVRPPEGLPGWVLPSAALTVLAVAAVAVRELRGRLAWKATRLHMESGRYEAAAASAQRAMRHPRHRVAAVLVLATALAMGKRFEEALAALARQAWSPSTEAARDYLVASIEARRGDLGAARRALASCLGRTPEYAVEAMANPDLRPLVRDAASEAGAEAPGGVAAGYA